MGPVDTGILPKRLLAAASVHHPDTRSNEFTDTRTNALTYRQTGSLAHDTAVLSSRNPIPFPGSLHSKRVLPNTNRTKTPRNPLEREHNRQDHPTMASRSSSSSKSKAFTGKATMPTKTVKSGMEKMLMMRGKPLPVGGEVRFRLVKSSWQSASADPVNPKAPTETFPLMAKFPESVVKPDFARHKRFYQQDIPKQKVRMILCGGVSEREREMELKESQWTQIATGTETYSHSHISFLDARVPTCVLKPSIIIPLASPHTHTHTMKQTNAHTHLCMRFGQPFFTGPHSLSLLLSDHHDHHHPSRITTYTYTHTLCRMIQKMKTKVLRTH